MNEEIGRKVQEAVDKALEGLDEWDERVSPRAFSGDEGS